ncbi:tumor necrosis factor receptor superfamily member 8 isoform X1 [Artibeus jamaicensis]|uniref:tumor necrosis factor receptor superfamily member 8 isoform X1 n=1 Tax=Artibeus jamaicensis TaxID=9417 RepID=UPI00235A71B1|nr:tumor necrosis factor receptor superfamily member 8 isoform X1 [Artibeus jamaicensis]XP_053516680.1 tumor necrosis factor receptor superfamily member 8 isoform X1 [Artibeus jamaicensis]
MCALRAVPALLLLGALRAFPQGQAPTDACAGDPSLYYDEAAKRCCFRCPVGLSPQQRCPRGSSDCKKQCPRDHYLDRDGRCTACVSCHDDLVERKPCSESSPRVCECQPGMFCSTTATNSCARCSPHSACPAGTAVKSPGTAERDTVCEPLPPGAGLDCGTSPEDCKAPTSGAAPQAKPILTSADSDARTTLLGGDTPLTPKDDSKMTRMPDSLSSGEKPSPDPGLSPQQRCPPGSTKCRKKCEPEYYVDGDGRCTACVSCSGDDLVEKTPCTWNSSRVCECRPGMFCSTSATNTCARCVACPIVPPETVAQLRGTAKIDTSYELPSPGTHLNCSTNPEDSKAPNSTSPSQLSPADSQASKGHGGGATHALEDASISTSVPISFPSTGRPILVSGSVLLWVLLALVVCIGSGSFLVCHRRACWKWIRQKLHLCRPVQTFRPQQEPVDPRPQRNQADLKTVVSVAEPSPGDLGMMSQPVPRESQPLLGASPGGDPSSPRDLPEPRVTTENTNNRIEKIYIMKADTVIVGTVKTEVPEGRGLAGPAGPELEEGLEVDHAHYPEQETEPPLGSCGDVMFSVEEQGKEDRLPTAASGK